MVQQKAVKIMDLVKEGVHEAMFRNVDTNAGLSLSRQEWEDMGQPPKVTVTVDVGDRLNTVMADGEDLETVTTLSEDVEDGFEVEQCSIHQTHPSHTWNRLNEPEKALMCEGLK